MSMVHWFGYLGEDGVHRYIYPSVRYESHIELRATSRVCCICCGGGFVKVAQGDGPTSALGYLHVTISRWNSAIVVFITVFLWLERTHQTGHID